MNLIVSAPQTSLLSTTETNSVITLTQYKGGKTDSNSLRQSLPSSQLLHTLSYFTICALLHNKFVNRKRSVCT
ncbi:hypothetical protein A2U01_0022534, partial [Trifolium medium]|nr:hypothetical protein [Trifolium medium]